MITISIDVSNLDYIASGHHVLDGVMLRSSARRIGVVGRNGSGKSTLARLLAGLIKPTSGTVRIADIDPFRCRDDALATVGILFQNPEHQIIFPIVSEEIAFGLREQGLTKAEVSLRTDEILSTFNKLHWKNAPVSALSQGQKHLLCMMAILAMRPLLVIVDEPFAGLDIPTRQQLSRYLLQEATQILHISHDPADFGHYDEVFWLDRGKIVAKGKPHDVLKLFTTEMNRLGASDDISDLID
jgi:biotin transport system ATP-binding protein